MPEPTYRIAQALHARRAAVGLKKYGQHLSADSPGCMIVHALEESADKTNYLIAEVQRRRKAIRILLDTAERLVQWDDVNLNEDARQLVRVIDLLGGEAALAKYDEILGGAEDATVAPDQAKPSTEQPELREYRFSRYANGKLKADGAVVMATSDRHAAEKLTKLCCDHPAILIGGQVPTTPDPRAGGWRPIAEFTDENEYLTCGAWVNGQWNVTRVMLSKPRAIALGYTHYLPEPEPPAREVPNERG